MPNLNADTIAAIATPQGRGGVGIVRISGPKTPEIALALLKKPPAVRKAVYSDFYDEKDQIIDHGIALFFKAPNSFTGEDILELHGHGGAIVLNMLLEAAINAGARPANPGEFSKQAFLNEKIDLAQAEAIADLIDAGSKQAARCALRSLQGQFSDQIHQAVEQLIHVRTHIEAAIDFPEDHLDLLEQSTINADLKRLQAQIQSVQALAKQGKMMRDGLSIAIVGRPNAGKSSLLNALTAEDSAIVTDIAGTTRDIIRTAIQIDGIPFHLADTAGLQSTENRIEKEGIRRTQKEIEQADHVLWLIDSANQTSEDDAEIDIKKENITRVQNKIDLSGRQPHIERQAKPPYCTIYLSAKTGSGLDLLKTHLKSLADITDSSENIFIARKRHLDALAHAQTHIQAAAECHKNANPSEFTAEELRLAQNHLSQITGEFTPNDLLDQIFSAFCIGK